MVHDQCIPFTLDKQTLHQQLNLELQLRPKPGRCRHVSAHAHRRVFTSTMRRIVDFVKQATSKQRKSPERAPRLIQGTSIAAAAQRIIEGTRQSYDALHALAELSRELPLLDSTELDESQLAPTRDIIRELRDIGEEIDAYNNICNWTITLETQGERKRLLNTARRAARRRAQEINKRLWTLVTRLHAQEPM